MLPSRKSTTSTGKGENRYEDADGMASDDDEFKDLYSLDISKPCPTFLPAGKIDLIPEINEQTKIIQRTLTHHEYFYFDYPFGDFLMSVDSIITKEEIFLPKAKATTVTVTDKFGCGYIVQRYSFWHLEFVVIELKNGEKYVGAKLCLDEIRWKNYPTMEAVATIFCTLQLLDEDYKIVVTQRSGELTFGIDKIGKRYIRKFCWPRFVSYEELFKYKSRLGERAAFHIKMDIFAKCPEKIGYGLENWNKFPTKSLEERGREYGEMWRARVPDVKIVSGQKTFLANKGLLQGRSSAFAKLLESITPPMNSHNSEIGVEPITLKLDDFDCDVIDAALNYMYTDQIDINRNFNKAKKLYEFADKYRICFFKKHLLASLHTTITVENAADVLEFAEMNDAPLNVCQDIIKFCEGNSEAILKRKES